MSREMASWLLWEAATLARSRCVQLATPTPILCYMTRGAINMAIYQTLRHFLSGGRILAFLFPARQYATFPCFRGLPGD